MTSATSTQLELSAYDFYTLIDTSGSMGKADVTIGGKNVERIQAAREMTEQMARVADKIDSDGGTVGFFSDSVKLYHNTTADKMETIFNSHTPGGSTATAEAIRETWSYHKTNSSKKMLLTIVTDGEPNDKGAVEKVICDISNSLNDASQVRIQFMQVGNDQATAQWLEHLDSGLQGKAKYDIFNYQTLEWVNSNGAERAFQEAVLDS